MEPLTKMQSRVLDTVNHLFNLKREFPNAGQIARRLRRSPSTITEHLGLLQSKGYVRLIKRGPWTLVRPIGVEACPWCGKPR